MTTVSVIIGSDSSPGGLSWGHAETPGLTSGAVTTNTIAYLPFYIPTQIAVDNMFYVGTSSPPTIELGIYSASASWMPATQLRTTGSFATISGTGTPHKKAITAITLGRGTYYLAYVATAAGSLNRTSFGGGLGLASSTGLLNEAGSSLPTTATGVAATLAYWPEIGLIPVGTSVPW